MGLGVDKLHQTGSRIDSKGTGQSFDQICLVTQMHDAVRLRIIDEAAGGVDQNYADLQEFYQRSLLLSLNRARGSPFHESSLPVLL